MLRLLALLLLVAAPAGSAEPTLPAGLAAAGEATAVEIVDGDTLLLNTGKEVRLVGVQAPKLPLGRKGFKTWPLADEAKAALAALTLKRRLRLFHGGRKVDRHKRLLAHLQDAETGRWIQGALLAQGMARVYSFRDNRAAVDAMLRLERAARRARRGIWAHRFYRVRAAETASRDIGSFQLVEGVVRRVATVRKNIYLNFGEDWRSDFTIVVRRRDAAAFQAAGLPLPQLEGRRIRVRGWLKSRNGPAIDATHPEQIEPLPDAR